MRIVHPEHATACSLRTCGMPLRFYAADGTLTYEAASTKRRCYFEVPSGTAYAVLCYTSNSGRRSIFVHDVRGGEIDERLPREEWPTWMAGVEMEWTTPAY